MRYPIIRRRSVPAVWDLERFFAWQPTTFATPSSWYPVVDIKETEDSLQINAELPGIEPDDASVTVEDGTLTITGEKKQETSESADDGSYHVFERSYGRFERSFKLPKNVDAEKVTANFENGVLRVALPKVEAAKARRIQIKRNGK